MISKLLYAFESGALYVRQHPQVLFALLLVIVLPLAFLYSGNQFLEAGKSGQDRLQKERIGMLHDVFTSLLVNTSFDAAIADNEISSIASLNSDITKFRIAKFEGGKIIPIAALDDAVVGVPETAEDGYQNSAVRSDTSIIFEYFVNDNRIWQSFRSVPREDGSMYFIFTETSLAQSDNLLLSKKRTAYVTLALIYIFVLLIAFWHIRVTDYRYLYKRASEAIATKDMFMNMIAHELRAPLTAVKGYASLIAEAQEARDEDKQSARRIQDSAERLIIIVSDLLDVARIQSGKLRIEKEACNVTEVLTNVVLELGSVAKSKNISLSVVGGEHVPDVLIDKKRLHQAFINLVSNAIKYTKDGTIELSLEEKRTEIEIRVKDTGMGISSEDQQKLFAPFFRVQSESVDQITGTGLGMWITRQLIELMGAKIGVESIKGVGTHIVITVPKNNS